MTSLPPPWVAPHGSARTPSILVVEDDDGTRLVIETALLDAGHEVTSVDRAEAALDVVASTRPDIILLDLRMPGIGGLGFLRAYPTLVDDPAPIVVLTATKPDPEELSGVAAVIAKPFELDELDRLIARYVGPAPP